MKVVQKAHSFLHYFHAAISNNLSEKPKICLLVYGRLSQVLLYKMVYGDNVNTKDNGDRPQRYTDVHIRYVVSTVNVAAPPTPTIGYG